MFLYLRKYFERELSSMFSGKRLTKVATLATRIQLGIDALNDLTDVFAGEVQIGNSIYTQKVRANITQHEYIVLREIAARRSYIGGTEITQELIGASGCVYRPWEDTPESFAQKYGFDPRDYPEYFRITKSGLVDVLPEFRTACNRYFAKAA